jgi:tetrahydromethanopterin S-methyltransferase subunit F
MQDQFLNFERQMEGETKVRKFAEESKLTGARETLSRLEKTLNAEIKRRVEANKALQEMFESQIIAVQEKLESGFEERLDKVDDAVNTISDRLGVIERDFAIERDRYVRDIEDKNALVARDVNALQTAFENERIVRAEKEALIIKRLADIEAKTDERVESSKVMLDNRILQIRGEMEEIYHTSHSGEDKFEKFVLEELASLKNSMLLESQSREAADDDLVNALNHYTKALQDALRIINSV